MSKSTATLALLLLIAAPIVARSGDLSPGDERKVRALDRAYVEAWLAGDPDQILDLFTADAVIVPSGMKPIRGHDQMRSFWWPDDGSRTVVEFYETRIEEAGGNGNLAWAWGTGRLAFTWHRGETIVSRTTDSVFMMIARRGADGSWKMTHRMWSDASGVARPAPAESEESSLIHRATLFRSLIELKEHEAARALMAPNPRRWWEVREGEGTPWIIEPGNAGPWSAWDDHFHSKKEVLGWRQKDRSATAVIREMNDYYRLLERRPVINEVTYYFDAEENVEGLLIRAVDERDPGRTEEFLRWARAHAPAELEAVMPEGEIDPTDPARFMRLLLRWRNAVEP